MIVHLFSLQKLRQTDVGWLNCLDKVQLDLNLLRLQPELLVFLLAANFCSLKLLSVKEAVNDSSLLLSLQRKGISYAFCLRFLC